MENSGKVNSFTDTYTNNIIFIQRLYRDFVCLKRLTDRRWTAQRESN